MQVETGLFCVLTILGMAVGVPARLAEDKAADEAFKNDMALFERGVEVHRAGARRAETPGRYHEPGHRIRRREVYHTWMGKQSSFSAHPRSTLERSSGSTDITRLPTTPQELSNLGILQKIRGGTVTFTDRWHTAPSAPPTSQRGRRSAHRNLHSIQEAEKVNVRAQPTPEEARRARGRHVRCSHRTRL